MKRETHGIFTDVASIIVGDPCKIMSRDDWLKLIERRWQHSQNSIGYSQEPFPLPDHGGILVPTIANCDGWCKTDVYRNKDGWPTRIVINLNSLVKEPGGES